LDRTQILNLDLGTPSSVSQKKRRRQKDNLKIIKWNISHI
jgi:hypothetical protein